MTNPSLEYKDRGPLSIEEVDEMLKKADSIKFEYFRLRVTAIVALGRSLVNAELRLFLGLVFFVSLKQSTPST